VTSSPSDETTKSGFSTVVVVIALVMVIAFLAAPPLSFLDKADLVGYAICHRIPDHSYFIAGRQLPLCARCSGTYLGAMLGFAAIWLSGRGRAGNLPPTRVIVVLASFIGLMALDGLNSYLHFFPDAPRLYEPHNILRLTTGTLNGLALSLIVYPVFNFTLWKRVSSERSLNSLRQLLGLLFLDALLILLVETRWAPLLWPVALVTTLGVVLMLTLVNTMIVVIVIRREGLATTLYEVLTPLLLGLVVTFFELTAMDLLRLFLTKTMALPF
jgi:uncharacterized membrane protein